MTKLSSGELARKVVHMAVGLIAFSMVYLGPLGSAACALGALLFNLFLLPRLGGKSLWRKGEVERGASLGIVFYPLAVLLLILCFWQRLEVAAAIWGILAFGDGTASLVGMTLGGAKLPWNEKKSWLGSFAFWLFGSAAATALLLWTAPVSGQTYEFSFALAVCSATALLAALVESLDIGLDDNLRVPLPAGLFLFCLLMTQGSWFDFFDAERWSWLAAGAGINLILAAAAFLARSVSVSGMIGGFVLGTTIYTCLGWRGYLLLLAFFVLGTGLTKLGYAKKAERKIAQADGGRRGLQHALANTGVATLAALFAATTPHPELFAVAFAAAFATAAADTAGSEVGQWIGRRTFLITSLRPVPPGTEGAVSVEGTIAGILASLLIAGLGAWVGLYPGPAVSAIVVAALVGTVLESVIGATIERRGLLDNETVNFLNTLIGALVGVALVAWWL